MSEVSSLRATIADRDNQLDQLQADSEELNNTIQGTGSAMHAVITCYYLRSVSYHVLLLTLCFLSRVITYTLFLTTSYYLYFISYHVLLFRLCFLPRVITYTP